MEDNNNLENFFKNKFNQKIEPEEWNTPDDDVWNNISNQLPEKSKKRKYGILPFILFSFPILLCLFLGLDNYKKQQDISRLKDELQACGSSEHQIYKPLTENKRHETVKTALIDKNTINDNDVPNNMPASNLHSAGSLSKYTRKTLSDSPLNTEKNKIGFIDVSKKRTYDSDTSQISEGFQEYIYQIPSIPALDIRNALNPNSIVIPTKLSSMDISSKQKSNRPTNKKLAIGPILGHYNWFDIKTGNIENPLSEFLIKEQTSPSFAAGFSIGKTLSKHFTFNSGIQYLQRNQNSHYALKLPYSTAEEKPDGSELENEFAHNLPTGLGSISTNLVLSRNINSPVNNNEEVNLEFSISNQTKALVIPLTLSYFPTLAGNGFFILGGFANEFIVENRIREISSESHHTFVKVKSLAVDYNANQINRFNLSALAGVGYQKEIYKDINFGLSVNYGIALTNTFATQNYKHRINFAGIQILLSKNLR
ncbi:MAG: hypothetical protein JNK41_08525 [Saprospiraceae bacterium]|jgi:hypothetical protein|nr:hypothetical protein [Saprospiraceae bacterium]